MIVKISVALATYNGGNYIEKQIDSIIRQTVLPNEVIIVDDVSKDNTATIVKKYLKYKDVEFKIYQNEKNLGYKKNFLKAISKCSGDFIFLCDQDDEWDNEKIEKMINIMINNKISVLSSSFRLIDSNSNILKIKSKLGFSNQNFYKRIVKKNKLVNVPIKDLLFHNMAQGCAMLITKDMKEKFINNFDENLPHDWQLNLLGAMENKTFFLNEELFSYRLHNENTIGYGLENTSFKEKFNIEIRLMTVYDCVKTVSFLKNVDMKYFEENELVKKYYTFSKNHIENLLSKRTLRLIMQNFNPVYFQVKSIKGRVMDIMYIYKSKRK